MGALARIDLDGPGTLEQDWRPWLECRGLRRVRYRDLVAPGQRLVVVAPHPDDELLAAGGLMATCAAAGREVSVIAVTNGTASHPRSSLWPRARLDSIRPRESGEALRRLGIITTVPHDTRLGFEDGSVAQHEFELVDSLRALLRASDVIVTTWRYDGHPDHDATGRAAARAAMQMGSTLIEAPVWAWHWAHPGDARMPWVRAIRLDIGLTIAATKRWALAAHASQLEADPSTGRAAILPPDVVRHFVRPFEVFFT
jgi:LmbE family N-acetylglucosaminyl deacetylase